MVVSVEKVVFGFVSIVSSVVVVVVVVVVVGVRVGIVVVGCCAKGKGSSSGCGKEIGTAGIVCARRRLVGE
jgi:hypothetical protein